MRTPHDPFSWDGEDQPVPPDDLTSGEESRQILASAETVVRDAQEAMARQDTDPNLDVGTAWAAAASDSPSSGVLAAATGAAIPLSRRTLAVLVAGCFLAFAHGWHVGAAAAAEKCGPPHCSPDTDAEKWKEEND